MTKLTIPNNCIKNEIKVNVDKWLEEMDSNQLYTLIGLCMSKIHEDVFYDYNQFLSEIIDNENFPSIFALKFIQKIAENAIQQMHKCDENNDKEIHDFIMIEKILNMIKEEE